jgi:NAD(P)H-hydrate epimerase
MKAVTREEIAFLDREASEKHHIPSSVLMENAGRAVAESVLRNYPKVQRIAVLAGKGNNAGDGFVAARYLSKNKSVTLFLFGDPERLKGDALSNFQALRSFPVKIEEFHETSPALNFPNFSSFDLLIDAVFGTGLKGVVEEFYQRIIETANGSGVPILAVDIPSGLDANSGKPLPVAIRASRTVTMGLPKVGLLAPSAYEFVGELEVADIGYPPELLFREGLKGHLLEPSDFKALLPPRKKDSHKGTYGKVLVIAGSLRYRGAANLAAFASLKVGAGLAVLALPRSLCLRNVRKPDEVIHLPLPETEDYTISLQALETALNEAEDSKAVVLGPGLSQHPSTRDFVLKFLKENPTPTLLDADGLNACASQPEVLLSTPAPLILTPHPGELSRLLKVRTAEIQEDRVGVCLKAALDFDSIVVLKGFRTVIGDPAGNFYINPTGNPGMASGGMGDVLAGTIGGLLAQGVTPLEACTLGVYAHGLAGDMVAAETGERGIVASDLLHKLPLALRSLLS